MGPVRYVGPGCKEWRGWRGWPAFGGVWGSWLYWVRQCFERGGGSGGCLAYMGSFPTSAGTATPAKITGRGGGPAEFLRVGILADIIGPVEVLRV